MCVSTIFISFNSSFEKNLSSIDSSLHFKSGIFLRVVVYKAMIDLITLPSGYAIMIEGSSYNLQNLISSSDNIIPVSSKVSLFTVNGRKRFCNQIYRLEVIGEEMIKAIYFDLFFTLIVPAYEKTNNEYDILNLSVSEWEQYAAT